MDNQNMTTEVKIAEINNMILRRIDALKELLETFCQIASITRLQKEKFNVMCIQETHNNN